MSTWEDLAPGQFGIDTSQPGADPMWIWAEGTRYREHALSGQRSVALVEDSRDLHAGLERFSSRRWTAPLWASHTPSHAFEFAEPVCPERTQLRRHRAKQGTLAVEPGRASVLVGVIDSGCPFASSMLRKARDRTRVLGIWDQDDADPAFEPVAGADAPKGFDYGRAVTRAQLNNVMAKAKRAGAIDEALCYQLAGYDPVMKSRFTHGGAVLSQLFGAPIRGQRPGEPGRPPAWDSANLAIDSADLVFVQLPRAAVQDSTSASLTRCVIDGLKYILGHALGTAPRPNRVVVNISSGTSRTLHDGTSMVESAIVHAIAVAERHGVELWVVLPSGNTNEEQRSAVLSDAGYPLELFLPPGCETPQYITVRWPSKCSDVGLRVTAPDGIAFTALAGHAKAWPSAGAPECGVIWPVSRTSLGKMLIAFAPTAAPSPTRVITRTGRWRLELEFTGASRTLPEPVRLWISRNQANPGAVPRTRQADFIDWDEKHNPLRYLRREREDPQPVQNGVLRDGAMSGLATAGLLHGRVVVVGSYELSSLTCRPSRYSGKPASASGGHGLNMVLAPGDMDANLPGLTVRGTLSGERVRVQGTSFAAPLVARALVNGVVLPTPSASSPIPPLAY